MRLIDANKLKNDMQKCLDENSDKKGSVAYITFELFIESIKKEPTVDAAEVVRCKDCLANGCCSVQIDLDTGEEGYCSKGRKENR
jgi:hypothetical protein